MSAIFLKDLAQKTHRGLEGRIKQGKSAGGISYGYTVSRTLKTDGTYTSGDRQINIKEASVVQRIFERYAAGLSPRAIAVSLNKEAVPGPSGRLWGASTISGNHRRGTGILNNELYVGKLVWNRQHFIKDPFTGKRQARPNSIEHWIINDVPELQIIEPELWARVKHRQEEASRVSKTVEYKHRPENARRTKCLLSGLITCGICHGGYTLVGGEHYGCAAARNKGTCDNRRTIKRSTIEHRVMEGLKKELLRPELLKTFIKEYQTQYNLAQAQIKQDRQFAENEITTIDKSIANMMKAISDGMYHPSMKAQLESLELKKNTLVQALQDKQPDDFIRIHPNMADIYQRKVDQLLTALNGSEETKVAATEILRSLIETIRLTPNSKNKLDIELIGELAGILMLCSDDKLNSAVKDQSNGIYSVRLVAGA